MMICLQWKPSRILIVVHYLDFGLTTLPWKRSRPVWRSRRKKRKGWSAMNSFLGGGGRSIALFQTNFPLYDACGPKSKVHTHKDCSKPSLEQFLGNISSPCNKILSRAVLRRGAKPKHQMILRQSIHPSWPTQTVLLWPLGDKISYK